MPPSPAVPCDQCQRLWIRVSLRNLRPLFARSQTVVPSMRRGRSRRNRSGAVSLRARLPSKDPQSAPRRCNQQVDEQALSSLKVKFQSADDLHGSKGSGPLLMGVLVNLSICVVVNDDLLQRTVASPLQGEG